METLINLFLKTELTGIPGFLNKYFGNYYNNTLCNGATWMFMFWFILHMSFSHFFQGLLKKMRFKEHVRMRLTRSLWYLGFYTSACIYSGASLYRNDIKLLNWGQPFDASGATSGHLILGFIVIITFNLHSFLWECINYQNIITASSYLSLFFLYFFSYFLRFIEGTFRLTLLICITQIVLELTRSVAVFNPITTKGRVLLGACFATNILVFVFNYLILVPYLFGFPLIKFFSVKIAVLLVSLIFWLIFEIYSSVLFKAGSHYFFHNNDKKQLKCDFDLFECSLFSPRFDSVYNFSVFRNEMKQRNDKYMALRKPKGRNAVYQTLKCMVAIKRKLNIKRSGMNTLQDSEDESDKISKSKSNSEQNSSQILEDTVNGKLEFCINDKNISGKSKQE